MHCLYQVFNINLLRLIVISKLISCKITMSLYGTFKALQVADIDFLVCI